MEKMLRDLLELQKKSVALIEKMIDSSASKAVIAGKVKVVPAQKKEEKKAKPSTSVNVREGYRPLRDSEKIRKGDEWRIKHGLKHSDGRKPRWKVVGDSIGSTPASYLNSIFRRKV